MLSKNQHSLILSKLIHLPFPPFKYWAFTLHLITPVNWERESANFLSNFAEMEGDGGRWRWMCHWIDTARIEWWASNQKHSRKGHSNGRRPDVACVERIAQTGGGQTSVEIQFLHALKIWNLWPCVTVTNPKNGTNFWNIFEQQL